MTTSAELRTISLWERYSGGPLWYPLGGLSAEGLRLSDQLCRRLDLWEDLIWDTPDGQKTLGNGLEAYTNAEISREGAVIAQSIANEMGRGVTVRFEAGRYFSMLPPTNPTARTELEEEVGVYERTLHINPKNLRWAAEERL